MTTVYVALPSPQKLEDNTNQFLAAIKSGTKAPQNTLFMQVCFDFLDVMLEGLFYGPTRQIELTSFRKRLVDALGGVIEKTTHGLVRSVIGKASNEELRRLTAFVEERRVYLNDAPHVSFPLPEAFTTRFEALHEATMSGSRENVDEQIIVMCEFIDISLDYMFKRPTELMQLGFIARKAVDIGYSSVRSMSHSTVRKIATDVSLEENQRLSTYFYELMKEGPDYRGS